MPPQQQTTTSPAIAVGSFQGQNEHENTYGTNFSQFPDKCNGKNGKKVFSVLTATYRR